MSIAFTYYRLSPVTREQVTRDELSWEEFRQGVQDAYFKSFHSALAALPAQATQEEKLGKFTAVLEESHDPKRFDMEKDWHTVAYLLTGESEISEVHREGDSLHNVILGGIATSVKTGYGPVRYFDEKLVNESAEAFRSFDRQLIVKRFNPERMAELHIYASPDAGEREGFFRLVERFANFFYEAASAKENVIKFAT